MPKRHTSHTPLPRTLVRKVCPLCKRGHDGTIGCGEYLAALRTIAHANRDNLTKAAQAMMARAALTKLRETQLPIESVDSVPVDKDTP